MLVLSSYAHSSEQFLTKAPAGRRDHGRRGVYDGGRVLPAMRILSLLLLACWIVPMATAHGDEGHGVELVITAHDDDGWYFMVSGYDDRNPTIVLPPGSDVSVTFRNEGSIAHNLRFAQMDGFATQIIDGGEEATLEFVVPAGGLSTYWCDPHVGLGMEGKVVDSEDALSKDSPGLAWPLLLVGLLVLARQR